MARMMASSSMCCGGGDWTRMPWMAGSALSCADDLHQFVLRGVGGQFDLARVEAELGTGAGFGADINLGRGVLADEHDGESGDDAFGC